MPNAFASGLRASASSYNRSGQIPGVSGKRIPGTARLPSPRGVGGFRTNIPFLHSENGQAGSALFREYHRQQVRDVRGRFAGGWGFAWQGLERIDANIESHNRDLHQKLRQAADKLKDEMVAYAQENAPWEDRTGDARRELQGAVVWQDEENFTIFLGHGAEIYYGIWLEVRWGGKYAIIVPTIQHFAPLVGERIRTMT